MNISRKAANGKRDNYDTMNKSTVMTTSAGYCDSFAYQKMLQILIWMILGKSAFVMGADYHIPVMHGLLDANFIEDLKQDGTYSDASFSREYGSKWSGSSEYSYYKADNIERCRTLTHFEEEHCKEPDCFYVLGVDVARTLAQTVIAVVKVIDKKSYYLKELVNLFVFEGKHFEIQSNFIKLQINNFRPKAVVVDTNGPGYGLVDFLVKPSYDEEHSMQYPGYGIINDDAGLYSEYSKNAIDLIYTVKADGGTNNMMHINLLNQLQMHRLLLLINENSAKSRLVKDGLYDMMSAEAKAKYLRPYTLTTILKDEMVNLKETKSVNNIVKLEQISKAKLGKDKFSALEMACFYIKSLEDKTFAFGKRKKRSLFDALLYN